MLLRRFWLEEAWLWLVPMVDLELAGTALLRWIARLMVRAGGTMVNFVARVPGVTGMVPITGVPVAPAGAMRN